MSGAGTLPRVQAAGFVVIRDERGWVKLPPDKQANPETIGPRIKAAMPQDQLNYLELDT
jgi:hypothetical protein